MNLDELHSLLTCKPDNGAVVGIEVAGAEVVLGTELILVFGEPISVGMAVVS